MTVLSGKTIERLGIVYPCLPRTKYKGVSYGLSMAGYDIRTKENLVLSPHDFKLAVSLEHFCMPNNVLGQVADKSTWARYGIAVQNTILEPGWRGFLTLEVTNHGFDRVEIVEGVAIAQVIFHFLDEPVEQGYDGKYQNQPAVPVGPILE